MSIDVNTEKEIRDLVFAYLEPIKDSIDEILTNLLMAEPIDVDIDEALRIAKDAFYSLYRV